MALKRTRHAVYEANYHLVWTPKYGKWILRGDLREYVCQLFHRIAEQYDYEFEELTIVEDHVHMLVSFPPRDSISKVVARFKSISAKEIFRQFPEVKRELWKGALLTQLDLAVLLNVCDAVVSDWSRQISGSF